ncbi:MAG TPA: GNAT family N-acetyltransferase [Kiloniellaceae bacterium]|nr:GNAT family N-acetyltransferase [Kiloniellaceae bacterium]
MRIRPASDDDRRAIAAIQTASWRATYRGMLPDAYLDGAVAADHRKNWQELAIAAGDLVLVAEDGGALVGFIAVWCRPDPYIDNLHVAAGQQGKGIGKALMAAAADRLQQRGHGTAYLWVFENNRPAIGFYESLGGRIAAQAAKEFYGQAVPSVKIAWPDLAVVGAAAGDSGTKAG